MLGIVTSVKQKSQELYGNFRSVMCYHCVENGKISRNTIVINILKYFRNGCDVICGQPNSYISGNVILINEDKVEHVFVPSELQLEELKLLLQLEKNHLLYEDMYDIESKDVISAIEDTIGLCEAIKNGKNEFPILFEDFLGRANYSSREKTSPQTIADMNDELKKLSSPTHPDDTNPIHQLHP